MVADEKTVSGIDMAKAIEEQQKLAKVEQKTEDKADNKEVKSIRMPSIGQTFMLLETKFEVVKSQGKTFKAKAIKK